MPNPPTRNVRAPQESNRDAVEEIEIDASSIASACPSERYSTLREVLQASDEELRKGCGKCSCCRLIYKAMQLKAPLYKRLMQQDVYEFDVNEDEEGLQPFRSVRDGDNNVYLDVLDDENELVKVFNITTQKDGKEVCSVYRVPRSRTQKIMDFFSVEHEDSLDQMVANLNADKEQASHNIEPNSAGSGTPGNKSFSSKAQKSGKIMHPYFTPRQKNSRIHYLILKKLCLSKYGICKVVPPKGFKPPCKVTDDLRFTVTNQYLSRLYSRWGPVAREMAAIKVYLATQSVFFNRSPLMLSQNENNLLRALGPILGVTVPTLHVNMVFSTSCWHSDPQGLPWVDYHHKGAAKIWYGVPHSESETFRKAVEKLCPSLCQNKSIWLPSDITMIPPKILLESKVSLARIEQNPGEFVIVFPKAYSCSISTGFGISESVYFATNSWLNSVRQVYQELRDSSEPTVFPLEHLLLSVAQDEKTSITILQQVHANLIDILEKEFHNRQVSKHLPIKVDGMEVDLPKFYHSVQRNGGIQEISANKDWHKVADEKHAEEHIEPWQEIGQHISQISSAV